MAESTAISERNPAIRTMRSDISEFMRTAKPSLVTLLAREVEWKETHGAATARPRPRRALVIFGAAAVIIAVAGAVTLRQFFLAPSPVTTLPPAPPPAIAFEETVAVGAGTEPSGLGQAIRAASATPLIAGTFRRLDLVIREGGATRRADLRTFAELTNARFPPEVVSGASSPPQAFLYRQVNGMRFGMFLAVRNPARAFAALLSGEPSLAADLAPFFIGSPPPFVTAPFRDRTYRNIDFRYLPLDPEDGRGIGYFQFPAKRLIVIASSEEALVRVIDRLFGAP